MKQLFVLGAIVIASSVALAQQFIITPVESNRDLERRIWRLERAVQELQMKVYNLQASQMQQPVQVVNPKKYFCKVSAFTRTFKAYGPSQLETKEKVQSQCAAAYNEMHCREVACELNE